MCVAAAVACVISVSIAISDQLDNGQFQRDLSSSRLSFTRDCCSASAVLGRPAACLGLLRCRQWRIGAGTCNMQSEPRLHVTCEA